ncbi:MAG: transcriptional regulator NrdR [Firmicutes bacterium]|nr:transcriptional regulator NrdR [Bacillota bacterium]
MKCLVCKDLESKVLDSRSCDDGRAIRRKRECLACGKRFTTYETAETTPILIVKNDGTRQPFDVNKIKNGIIKACEKRAVSLEQIDGLVQAVSAKIHNSLDQEIYSTDIGEAVMAELKKFDDVAYVRFASVYRKFTDITKFVHFIQEKLEEGK